MAMFEAYFGLFLAAEDAYPAAREHLDRALDLDPHSAVVHFLAASAACVMGDLLTVERHCVRALELQPESLGPRWPQTVALLAAGRTDEALVAGERVVAVTRMPIYLGVLGMMGVRRPPGRRAPAGPGAGRAAEPWGIRRAGRAALRPPGSERRGRSADGSRRLYRWRRRAVLRRRDQPLDPRHPPRRPGDRSAPRPPARRRASLNIPHAIPRALSISARLARQACRRHR